MERLADFLEHNQIATIRREGPSIISLLTDLEERMVDAGLWLHPEGEALPLDKAAARRMEPDPGGLNDWAGWRSPGVWGPDKLRAFAVRAFIDAEHKLDLVNPKYRETRTTA
jgi:hypothetical protein